MKVLGLKVLHEWYFVEFDLGKNWIFLFLIISILYLMFFQQVVDRRQIFPMILRAQLIFHFLHPRVQIFDHSVEQQSLVGVL